MDDNNSHTAPDRGQDGQAGPEIGTEVTPVYSLNMNQVSFLFDQAQLPRSRRTLLRYCQHDKLDCTKVETLHGEQYFVSEASVERLVAEILERERFTRLPQVDNYPGAPGQAPAGLVSSERENPHPGSDGQGATNPGQTGQENATLPPLTDERLLKQVEGENELLRTQMEVKDTQIERMNGQIDDLIERGREDKHLLQNFQRKLGMLAAPEEKTRQETFSGTEQNISPQNELPVDSSGTLPGENML